jgi:hypothetical protein
MDFVVSLTSHFRRTHFIEAAINELRNQTLLPKIVVINLPSGFDFALSPEFSASFPAHIEINRVEDYGPATKLLPTLLRHPDLPVITIDDDAHYRPELFEELLSFSATFPGRRIAARARFVPPGKRPWLVPYLFWPKIMLSEPVVESRALPLGAEGVLYPPGSLEDSVWDISVMRRTSPKNDDLWFWTHGEKRSPGVVVLPYQPDAPRRLGSEKSGLWQSNRGSKNNVALKNLVKHYPPKTHGARSRISFPRQLLANLIEEVPRKFNVS